VAARVPPAPRPEANKRIPGRIGLVVPGPPIDARRLNQGSNTDKDKGSGPQIPDPAMEFGPERTTDDTGHANWQTENPDPKLIRGWKLVPSVFSSVFDPWLIGLNSNLRMTCLTEIPDPDLIRVTGSCILCSSVFDPWLIPGDPWLNGWGCGRERSIPGPRRDEDRTVVTIGDST
jgi:hypothetical protein